MDAIISINISRQHLTVEYVPATLWAKENELARIHKKQYGFVHTTLRASRCDTSPSAMPEAVRVLSLTCGAEKPSLTWHRGVFCTLPTEWKIRRDNGSLTVIYRPMNRHTEGLIRLENKTNWPARLMDHRQMGPISVPGEKLREYVQLATGG
ncbi:hypothetical protein Bbelb_010090 [Branchiostoma belcheri]|nr:hypothetical protein Bbelb_010090 [Branchiostoma belcheri]